MKLFNQFTILKKNLRDIDYLTKEKVNFSNKESKENVTKKIIA